MLFVRNLLRFPVNKVHFSRHTFAELRDRENNLPLKQNVLIRGGVLIII